MGVYISIKKPTSTVVDLALMEECTVMTINPTAAVIVSGQFSLAND